MFVYNAYLQVFRPSRFHLNRCKKLSLTDYKSEKTLKALRISGIKKYFNKNHCPNHDQSHWASRLGTLLSYAMQAILNSSKIDSGADARDEFIYLILLFNAF